MSEIIIDFFASLPEELYVLVVSLFPIVELRGSIPLGAGLGMPFYTNYICSVIGNLIPIPFILLFISKFLDFLSRFKRTKPLVDWLRRKADKHSSRVLVEGTESESAELEATYSARGEKQFKSSHRAMSAAVFWALTLFVAIPLPGTGAWTGSLVAALFGLPKRKSFLAVTLGVLISGVIMCLASYGVVGFLQIFA